MSELERLLERYPKLEGCREDILKAFLAMEDTFKKGGKLLICGNGGSAADSDHIVGELMKGFRKKRPLSQEKREKLGSLSDHLQEALPAISLTGHQALSTAFLNDVAPDMVFAQQVYGYGRKNDSLLAITTSGNSENVLNAVKVAKALELKVIGLTGPQGGELKKLADICICVPGESTADVQELHLPVYHALCAMLEDAFFEY
ncbi:MAG: SIS domain-containing protein [Clostridia bacterium]|nr:SIS domain-containing protein [Clostridia bacterium]MDY5555492.1 SIS domain-containing protein [Blautia sp.]